MNYVLGGRSLQELVATLLRVTGFLYCCTSRPSLLVVPIVTNKCMKKSLLVVIAFLLAPMVVGAQTKSPVEQEIEQLGLPRVSFKIAASAKPRNASPAAAQLFSVEVANASVFFTPTLHHDTDVAIEGWITNLSGAPLTMGFIREQQLPESWKSSVCFGQNCYPDFVSAKVAEEPWKVDERREFILHVVSSPGAQGTGVIKVTVYSPGTQDSIDVIFNAAALPIPVSECRTFLFKNPYAGEVVLKNYSIANPELFDITLTSDTEYPTYEGGRFEVKFCSKLSDGLEHSTVMTFETDSGTFEQTVTLMAPGSASVSPSRSASGVNIVSVSPNPASSHKQVSVNLESARSANVTLSIVDLLGREVRTMNTIAATGSSSLQFDAGEIPVGSYIVLMKENGELIDQASFNVTR
jgi:hypothetical protein